MVDNFTSSREMMNPYLQKELFRRPKPKPKISYGRENVQIGRRVRDGSVYTLNVKEASRMLILGLTRCMPLGTLVKTKNGLEKIEDVKEVASYNFEKNKIEYKKCVVHNKSIQKIVRIKTSVGEVVCSHNHKMYAKRNGDIMLIEAKDFRKTDKLLKVL